jgi:hypothetical protein
MKNLIAAIAISAALASPSGASAQSATDEKMTERLKGAEYVAKQQPQTWLAVNFIGAPVKNSGGETIGNINNLLVHENGEVVAALIGVGGVLGIGEKTIAVPFGAMTIKRGEGGMRMFVVELSRRELEKAAPFEQTEPGISDQARAMLQRAGETLKTAVERMQKSAEDMTGKAKKSMESGSEAPSGDAKKMQ